MYKLISTFFLILIFSTTDTLISQEILLQEDFDECLLPSDWSIEITNDQNDGFAIAYPTNPQSDSLSIDGTCMVIFDDDLLGNNTPSFMATLTTPSISTNNYQTLRLRTDVHFRSYQESSFTIFLEENDGTRVMLKKYEASDQTGSQFSEFAPFLVDLSFFTSSSEFKIVYEYDDAGLYAWWAGIDNVSITGSGKGETIVLEQFNDCSIPENWSTNIVTGDHDWVFGKVDNPKTSSTSIDGSCFVFFDDDVIGGDVPYSIAELITPVFDGSQYATFQLDFDLIFRQWREAENISIFVYDGEEYTLVKSYFDPVSGPHFNQYEGITLDLTPYRTVNMQVVFRYDDGNTYGWWTGLDNVKIIGYGEINDLCTTADTLDIGKACITSNNLNAVFSGPESQNGDRLVGSLWYDLIAPVDGNVLIQNIADYNDYITVFDDQCDDLTELNIFNKAEHGFEGETIILPVTKGKTYKIRICGIKAKHGASKGHNCISAKYIDVIPPIPFENIKDNAIVLSIDQDCQVSTNINASIEDIIPLNNELTRADIWYSFNVTEEANYSFQIETDFAEISTIYDDQQNEIYSQYLGGNILDVSLNADHTYYLQIGGVFSLLEGNVCVSFEKNNIQDNIADHCVEASELIMDLSFSLDNSIQTFSGIYPTCDIYTTHDYWLAFDTEDEEFIYLNFKSDFVNTIAIYSGPCDTLTEVWCDKNINKCNGEEFISGLETYTTYYIQVSSSETNNPGQVGLSTISISTTETEEDILGLNVSTKCNNDGTAELLISVTGPQIYTLFGNATGEILEEGEMYIVMVQDENGCEKSEQGIIECQSTNCNLQVESYLFYPSCFGSNEGSILLEVNDGLGPYDFEWDHTTENTAELNQLNEGIYQVKIIDFNGCFTHETIIIEQPVALSSTVESTDLTAYNSDDGTAFAQISGGTFPYYYSWSTNETTESIGNLPPGDYSVTITDYNGCEKVHTFIINNTDCSFILEEEIFQVSCNGDEDGQIVVTTDEEIESAIWNTGDMGLILDDIPAGEYTLTLIKSDGCETIQEYTVIQPDVLESTETIVDVLCYGDENGIISLTSVGGNGGYSYVWEDGYIGAERSGLLAGSYTLEIIDEKLCAIEKTIVVESPDSLSSASTVIENPSCSDSQDGSICIFIEGGTLPYVFEWNGNISTSKITDLEAADYNLMVIDSNGCTISTTISISAPDPIEAILENLTISEEGDGIIDISIDGGTGPYSVTWYKDGEIIANGEDLENLGEGIYHAVIVDANGCEFTTSDYHLMIVAVTELELSSITIYPNPASKVFTISSQTIDLSQYELSIVGINGQLITDQFTLSTSTEKEMMIKVGNVASGMYIVELTGIKDRDKLRVPVIIEK